MVDHDPDYWYHNQHELECEQVFRIYDNSLVKLDRRVPGDGTRWYVGDWHEGFTRGDISISAGWSYCDSTIEPGDLRGDPLPDPAAK